MNISHEILSPFFLGIPIAFSVGTVTYGILIWRALSRKGEIKARIWHKSSGFSLETHSREDLREPKDP
jgi:hypothetical protein